jgi:hypothetical protein
MLLLPSALRISQMSTANTAASTSTTNLAPTAAPTTDATDSVLHIDIHNDVDVLHGRLKIENGISLTLPLADTS